MSLYTLPKEYNDALQEFYELFDLDTGELTASEEKLKEVQSKIADLENRAGEGLEYLAKKYRNESLEIEALESEIERLVKRKQSQEKRNEHLKKFLEYLFFKLSGGEYKKAVIGNFTFSYRKSESVKIIDETKIPKQFMNEKVQVSPDKKAIKEALKNGNVAGVELEVKQNFNIK